MFAAALVGIVLATAFWIPYAPERLLRPIPSGAFFVSAHNDLGARLESLRTGVFTRRLFACSSVSSFLARHGRLAEKLAARKTVFACAPDQHPSAGQVYVCSTWIGVWSTALRWALWLGCPAEVMPLGVYNGRKLWTFRQPISAAGEKAFLSFALDEGLLVACVSRERSAIARLMNIYDGPGGFADDVCQDLADSGGPVRDRARFLWHNARGSKAVTLRGACSLTVLETNRLAAEICLEPGLDLEQSSIKTRDKACIERLLSLSPSIAGVFASGLVQIGLDNCLAPDWIEVFRPLISPAADSGQACLLAVFDGPLGGRAGAAPFRIAVPTLLLAFPGWREEEGRAAVAAAADLVNARARLGLIVNATLPPAGGCRIYALESTSGAPVSSWALDDQPAFAFSGGWLLLASNGAGLRNLLEAVNSTAPTGAATGASRWILARLDAAGDNIARTGALVSIEPGAGGRALRLAMTALIVTLESSGAERINRLPASLARSVRAWTEDVGAMEFCRASLESGDGKTLVKIEMGSGR